MSLQDVPRCVLPGPICPPECRRKCPAYAMLERLGAAVSPDPEQGKREVIGAIQIILERFQPSE